MKQLTKSQKHDILVMAKDRYMSGVGMGMCYPIEKSFLRYMEEENLYPPEKYGHNEDRYPYLGDIFPEFNPLFLGGDGDKAFWWPTSDGESRINAFNKLIKIYES